ncbi:hypothetical protein K474DRAFT_1601966, partial [Panus rudis PR-1116 ss-1]
RLQKGWTSPTYAFFKPVVEIVSRDGRRAHGFNCALCKTQVLRFLDTHDSTSTANLQKHAVKCFGEDAVKMTKGMSASDARTAVGTYQRNGSITEAFARVGKGVVTFSTTGHTKEETSLPAPSTVGRDIKKVFARTHKRVSDLLVRYEGELNFAADCWTSPNHRAFCAISVHLTHNREKLRLLLDVVEVPVSHSGQNLANVMQKVMEEFNITTKVSISMNTSVKK